MGLQRLKYLKLKKNLKQINILAFNQINKNIEKLEILKEKQKIVTKSNMYSIDKSTGSQKTLKVWNLLICWISEMWIYRNKLLNSFVNEKL